MTNSSVLPRKNWVRSFYDKFSFVIVFVTGAIGILGFKWLQIEQIYVTVFAVLLMVIYAISLAIIPERRLTEDQSGDNLYYLGFLYTLVSLSYALYSFSTSTEQTYIIDPIISSFGIALATTIVGIMLRILFNQMRHDIVDVEVQARVELAEAASRLRTELDQITLDMNHFGRATRQSIEETLQQNSQAACSAMKESATEFGKVTGILVSRMNFSLDKFAQNIEQLNTQSKTMVSAIEVLIERIEKIETPEDLIITKIAPAMEAIKEAGNAINKRASGDAKVLARLKTAIENALGSSAVLEQNVSALNTIALQAQENMINLNKSVELGSTIYTTISSTVTEAQQLTQEHTKALQEIKSSFSDTAIALSSLVTSWQTEVDSAINLITQKGSDTQATIGQTLTLIKDQELRAIQEMAVTSDSVLATIKKHSIELEQELNKSRQSTLQVHKGLNDIIDEITTRLDS